MEIKLNDVYRFSYSQKYYDELSYPYWCFDGQLIVKQNHKGELYLVDTYLGFNDSSNKSFTLEQALERGTLTFICNLDEVEKCNEYDTRYYADEDIFNLSYQRNCYKNYYKRKDAKKSIDKMKESINDIIIKTECEISCKIDYLAHLKGKLVKIESGDDSIYF